MVTKMRQPSYADRTVETYNTLRDGSQTAKVWAKGLNNGTPLACFRVFVQAGLKNEQPVFVGNASTQSICLEAGDTESIPINDVSKVWVRTSVGEATVNWHAVS